MIQRVISIFTKGAMMHQLDMVFEKETVGSGQLACPECASSAEQFLYLSKTMKVIEKNYFVCLESDITEAHPDVDSGIDIEVVSN